MAWLSFALRWAKREGITQCRIIRWRSQPRSFLSGQQVSRIVWPLFAACSAVWEIKSQDRLILVLGNQSGLMWIIIVGETRLELWGPVFLDIDSWETVVFYTKDKGKHSTSEISHSCFCHSFTSKEDASCPFQEKKSRGVSLSSIILHPVKWPRCFYPQWRVIALSLSQGVGDGCVCLILCYCVRKEMCMCD